MFVLQSRHRHCVVTLCAIKSLIITAMHVVFKMSLMQQEEKRNTFTSTRRTSFCGLWRFTEGLCTRHNQVNRLLKSKKIEGVAGNSTYDDYFKMARRTIPVTAKMDGRTWFPKLVVALVEVDVVGGDVDEAFMEAETVGEGEGLLLVFPQLWAIITAKKVTATRYFILNYRLRKVLCSLSTKAGFVYSERRTAPTSNSKGFLMRDKWLPHALCMHA